MSTIQVANERKKIVDQLASQYDIDPERVLFLNENKPTEAWLSADLLLQIARKEDVFQSIDEGFNQFIQPLNQVVHAATVIDKSGRSFSRCGIASIGERADVDEHQLAAGRALKAAFTAAGFDPTRGGSVVRLDTARASQGGRPQQSSSVSSDDEVGLRNADLKRVHAVAERKGLIAQLPFGGYERLKYREHLQKHYGVNSAAGFDALQRQSLINSMEMLPDADTAPIIDEFENVA